VTLPKMDDEIVNVWRAQRSPRRRFPPPWTAEEANNACFIVKDANGFAVSYVYSGTAHWRKQSQAAWRGERAEKRRVKRGDGPINRYQRSIVPVRRIFFCSKSTP
jgi:hypothetical protein